MGEKDLSTKNLEAYNDVFADIFNVLIFHEDYIEESLLVDGPTETQYMTETGNLHTHHRDCMKYYQDTRLACVTFGIENQTTVDKSMPVRMMSYDCDRYIAQLKNEEAISPIVSIVLYFGDGHWDKPLSLYDMYPQIPTQIKPYVNDYSIHVIDIKLIPKELRSKLKSDFKVIADFFAEKDDKNYTPSNDAIKHPEAVLHMLKVFTNDNRYDDIEESMLLDIREGKVITMCNFAERMEQKGIQKGRQEGRQEGESLLAEAIFALKAGRTIEELKDAYNDHTLELAQKCLY